MFQRRQIKNTRVSDKPYNLNNFLGLYYDGIHNANLWYPASAHYKTRKVYDQNNHGITSPWVNQNFSVGGGVGTVKLPHNVTYISCPYKLNSLEPLSAAGVTGTESPIAPLDIISMFYKNYRITSAKFEITFMVDPTSVDSVEELANVSNETSYWYGELRFGVYVSDSATPVTAWGTDKDGNALTEAEAEGRIKEAVEAGLLTTVPLTVSNDPKYINNSATISTGWINIMNQYQNTKTDVPDPAVFTGNLHSKLANQGQNSINDPANVLYIHPFVYISKEIRKWGTQGTGYIEQSLTIDTNISHESVVKFDDPRIRMAEGEAWQ